jgi:hypothetical protein
MADIDVGTPGFAIDITAADFLFDGQSLSAAIESMEWSTKTEEELVHYQGEEDPVDRTKGQRTHEANLAWGTRQYLLFCAYFGGEAGIKGKEFTLEVQGRPENDPNLYGFTFYRFRLLDDGMNFDKSASKNKVRASFMKREIEVQE